MNRATLALYLRDAWKPYSEAFFKYVDLNNPSDVLYIKSNYLAMLGLIDTELEKLLDILDSRQLSNKTIVLIRSNKADGFREYSYNLFKRNLYQELIHTPLMMRIPQVSPGMINGFTQDIDITPTLLELVGIDIPDQAQGKSLVPLMKNPIASVNDYQIAQKGSGDYVSSLRKDDWKIIMKESRPIELYNLVQDPEESINVINIEKEKVMQLSALYNLVIKNLPIYGNAASPLPSWIDEEKRERLKDEGYF
jgi:arylsulfatase A-like enzyme